MGQFGEVWLAESGKANDTSEPKEKFALKVLKRDRFKTAEHEQVVMNERDALESLKHPFLIGLINS